MNLYKHIRNTDVAIRILQKFYDPISNTFSLKIEWWNIVNKPFFMQLKETIIIKQKDWKNWRIYE